MVEWEEEGESMTDLKKYVYYEWCSVAYCLSLIWVNNVGWRGAADNFLGRGGHKRNQGRSFYIILIVSQRA